MTHYGYITDNTYEVADTAITWDFVYYNEDESTTEHVGIESTVSIDSAKVTMFESASAFNAWRYEFNNEGI